MGCGVGFGVDGPGFGFGVWVGVGPGAEIGVWVPLCVSSVVGPGGPGVGSFDRLWYREWDH